MKSSSKIIEKYKYLWVLIFTYVFITIASDLYESKLISIYMLHAGAGILLFSFTFFLIEVITEVYGYKNARLAIWLSIGFSIFFIIYSTCISLIASLSIDNPIDWIIHQTRNIYISTILTVFIAEHINAYIVSKLKIIFAGRYIGIRFVLSTFIATGISMSIFTTTAFLGKMPFADFLIFTASSWLYRFLTELLLVPLSVKLSSLLKRKEGIDIFDFDTNYNVLNFSTDYKAKNLKSLHEKKGEIQ